MIKCEILKYFAIGRLLVVFLFSGGIVVQSVETIRAVFAQVLFIFRGIFRVFLEVSLELLAAMLVAPFFERTFQIPHLSLVGVWHNRILNLKLGAETPTLSLWLES